jgi:hypothetical protein
LVLGLWWWGGGELDPGLLIFVAHAQSISGF